MLLDDSSIPIIYNVTFTKTSDRQRINRVIDRARRLGYCSPDLANFDELSDIADDELFGKAALLGTTY